MYQLQTCAVSAQDSMVTILSEKASEDVVYCRVSSPSNVSLGHPQMQGTIMQQDFFVSLTLKSAWIYEYGDTCTKASLSVFKSLMVTL